jgi:hypothetical protein
MKMRGKVELLCNTDEVIRVIKNGTNYGRSQPYNEICPYSGGASPDITCQSNKSFNVVKKLCNGKQHCEINPTNDVFGDPCVGTYKYLKVNYMCVFKR